MLRRVQLSSLNGRRHAIQSSRRLFSSVFDVKTKGSPHMKHLDIYARRDPQLAPYLLREVDIEFKRKCRKVNFCFWVAAFVTMSLFLRQLKSDELDLLVQYADLIRKEQDAKDDDFAVRRRVFVKYMAIVKSAFNSDQKWSDVYAQKVHTLLTQQNASGN